MFCGIEMSFIRLFFFDILDCFGKEHSHFSSAWNSLIKSVFIYFLATPDSIADLAIASASPAFIL